MTNPTSPSPAVAADVRTILAIDPGTVRSAFVLYSPGQRRILEKGIVPNEELLLNLRETVFLRAVVVVIERVMSYGMPIGVETIETIHWAGRFAEAVYPVPIYRVPRMAVRLAICGSPRAKDPNVRQALLDRFGGDAAIGRKKTPGPLYGIRADLWAALGVAVTWADMSPDLRAEARLP